MFDSVQINEVVLTVGAAKAKGPRFTEVDSGELSGKPLKQAVIGVSRSPAEFIEKAWTIRHPIDMPACLPEVMYSGC